MITTSEPTTPTTLVYCKLAFNNRQILIIIHPKLCSINLHNVTHSLTSQTPTERICLQFKSHSLLSHLFSHISRISSLMRTTQEGSPHPRIAPCVNMWSVFFFFFFFSFVTGRMLVHAYATPPGKAKWSGPHQRK